MSNKAVVFYSTAVMLGDAYACHLCNRQSCDKRGNTCQHENADKHKDNKAAGIATLITCWQQPTWARYLCFCLLVLPAGKQCNPIGVATPRTAANSLASCNYTVAGCPSAISPTSGSVRRNEAGSRLYIALHKPDWCI